MRCALTCLGEALHAILHILVNLDRNGTGCGAGHVNFTPGIEKYYLTILGSSLDNSVQLHWVLIRMT